MAVKTQAQLLAQVASLLADNTTGDISALDVRTCLNDIIDSASYGGKKVYKALLTQTGTNAPVATVLENNLSGTPVWSRDSTGVYRLTLSSEFVLNNTIYYITPSDNSSNTDIRLSLFNGAPNYLSIETRFSGTLTDELLYYTPITIEVYP